MHDWSAQFQILGQVLLAGVLGGLIGLERELKGKPAGIRTQMFVAAAAALLVALGAIMVRQFESSIPIAALRSDPLRIMEAIITGISFIGAGTIIVRRGDHPEGITTAASILLTAALGIAVALNQIALAVTLTLLAVVLLYSLGRLEKRLIRKKRKHGDDSQPGEEPHDSAGLD